MTKRFCHPSGWQWIETSEGEEGQDVVRVSAILRDGSGLKHDPAVAADQSQKVSAILRDGSGLKHDAHGAFLGDITSFCHPSGWQWIETSIERVWGLRVQGFCHPSGWQWIETGFWRNKSKSFMFLPSFGMAVD